MISQIDIRKLFGRFDYRIPLQREGVTIITGPNGFGKSTILKIVAAISKGDIAYFHDLDFASLTVYFTNGKKAVICRTGKGLTLDGMAVPKGNIHYLDTRFWNDRNRSTYYSFLQKYAIENPELLREADPDLLERNNILIEGLDLASRKKTKNDWRKRLKEIQDWCGEVRLISDQRLLEYQKSRPHSPREEDGTPSMVDVITRLPSRLKSQISDVSERYSRVANKLDSTYPKRLFAAKEGLKGPDEYTALLAETNEKFQKLNHYNLIDMTRLEAPAYKAEYATALKIYFNDFAEKFTVFQELISKLDLFTKIINNRLTFKEIRITREKGFEVVDKAAPTKALQLSQLSSGEKQEIVLFYELIFDTKSNLLLIDEPEISLHISWQKQFLDDLLEVSKEVALQAIVATHSPQIVSNHMDIQIDLGEMYGSELNTSQSE